MKIVMLLAVIGQLLACTGNKINIQAPVSAVQDTIGGPWNLSAAEWQAKLTKEEYYVLREKGTERPFSGKLLDNHETGTFVCGGCALPLFESKTKFESGTGWPSFWQAISDKNVYVSADNSHGMSRDEVVCGRCGGHLGHVFNDGPQPTGLRYCMNSVSLKFLPQQ